MSKGLAVFAFLFGLIFTSSPIVFSQQLDCGAGWPKCYSNLEPFAGHGAASSLPPQLCSTCSGDSRRVVTIRIDASWNDHTDSSGNPATNNNIWNAVQCAVNQWNTVKNGSSTTGYYLVVDQGGLVSGPPDINITNSGTSGTRAATDVNASGGANRHGTIYLRNDNGNFGGGSFSASDLCGRVAHEIGHNLGLANLIDGCATIMDGGYPDGKRSQNAVKPSDVAQVNANFASRGNCDTTTTADSSAEKSIGESGGDPCGGDPCCGDPYCGDPCAGDPCCNDPYCGDPCRGDPNCGQQCFTVCTSYCYEYCGVREYYSGECIYSQVSCEESCETQCY